MTKKDTDATWQEPSMKSAFMGKDIKTKAPLWVNVDLGSVLSGEIVQYQGQQWEALNRFGEYSIKGRRTMEYVKLRGLEGGASCLLRDAEKEIQVEAAMVKVPVDVLVRAETQYAFIDNEGTRWDVLNVAQNGLINFLLKNSQSAQKNWVPFQQKDEVNVLVRKRKADSLQKVLKEHKGKVEKEKPQAKSIIKKATGTKVPTGIFTDAVNHASIQPIYHAPYKAVDCRIGDVVSHGVTSRKKDLRVAEKSLTRTSNGRAIFKMVLRDSKGIIQEIVKHQNAEVFVGQKTGTVPMYALSFQVAQLEPQWLFSKEGDKFHAWKVKEMRRVEVEDRLLIRARLQNPHKEKVISEVTFSPSDLVVVAQSDAGWVLSEGRINHMEKVKDRKDQHKARMQAKKAAQSENSPKPTPTHQEEKKTSQKGQKQVSEASKKEPNQPDKPIYLSITEEGLIFVDDYLLPFLQGDMLQIDGHSVMKFRIVHPANEESPLTEDELEFFVPEENAAAFALFLGNLMAISRGFTHFGKGSKHVSYMGFDLDKETIIQRVQSKKKKWTEAAIKEMSSLFPLFEGKPEGEKLH